MLYVHLVVWSFVCLFVTMPKCLIHKKMVVDCILVIKAMGKTLISTRLDEEKLMIGPASIVDTKSCSDTQQI